MRLPGKTLLFVGLPAILLLFLSLFLQIFPRRVSIRFNLSDTMPLGGYARIKTKENTQVELLIEGQNNNDIRVTFREYGKEHIIPVLGLYPDHVNNVTFSLHEEGGAFETRTLKIKTAALPDNFPEIEVNRLKPEKTAPGMLFTHLGAYNEEGSYSPLTCAVDSFGKVRWFYTESIGHVMKRIANGNFMIQDGDSLVEMDMLGTFTGHRITVPRGIHHDALVLPGSGV